VTLLRAKGYSNRDGVWMDRQNVEDGLLMLKALDAKSVRVAFFDPQHRPLMDKMRYGNEGARMSARSALPQMPTTVVYDFVCEIARVLRPSGYLFLWVDKFALVQGTFNNPLLSSVDLITWEKSRIGMGYRTRRKSDYLLAMQRPPLAARATWRTKPMIPDVWTNEREAAARLYYSKEERTILKKPEGLHPHAKPEGLQRRIIEATTRRGDVVVDPAAGGYSVMRSALAAGRHFLGCDLRRWEGTK
jgi:site-specific DNA-methyltransferase (adenine-specific)